MISGNWFKATLILSEVDCTALQPPLLFKDSCCVRSSILPGSAQFATQGLEHTTIKYRTYQKVHLIVKPTSCTAYNWIRVQDRTWKCSASRGLGHPLLVFVEGVEFERLPLVYLRSQTRGGVSMVVTVVDQWHDSIHVFVVCVAEERLSRIRGICSAYLA